MSDTCKMPGCEEESRERGDYEYPDDPEKTASNGERFTVGVYGAKFCSIGCELKYEKRKSEAQEAKRSEEEQSGVPKSDLPEYDGPPY